MMLPSFMTKIKSASRIVENLCATVNDILFYMRLFNDCYTIFSFLLSKALVASSNKYKRGSFITALATAILCFYTPDI